MKQYITSFKKLIVIILICSNILFSSESKIEFKNATITFLHNGKKQYSIIAKKYFLDFSQTDISEFILNNRKYMLDNFYYSDGKFMKNSVSLHFDKAYKFAQKVYMFNVNGVINGGKIKAKDAIYYKDNILFKNCEYNTVKKVYRRRKLILQIK